MTGSDTGMIDPFPSAHPFVIAHGFANHLETLRQAERSSVDLIEADIWLYRDRLEVRHSKTLGPIPVLWDFWSLEPGWTPRFELSELLDAKQATTRILFDLKGRSPDVAEIFMETMKRLDSSNHLLVCSQNWMALDQLRPYPDVTRIYSIGSRRQLARAWDRLEQESHDNVSIDARILDSSTVRALKDRVSTVITWPVNTTERLKSVLDWGVDGFTSDNLDLMRAFVQHRRVRIP